MHLMSFLYMYVLVLETSIINCDHQGVWLFSICDQRFSGSFYVFQRPVLTMLSAELMAGPSIRGLEPKLEIPAHLAIINFTLCV